MILQTIIQVAAKCGWSVTANVRDGNITSFDFRRNTESGVPFCFSADMTGSKPASLVDDILSFIDAFQPDIFARQWCRISGYNVFQEALFLFHRIIKYPVSNDGYYEKSYSLALTVEILFIYALEVF